MAVTLVVEDGTGLTNANTFCTLAEAETYHDERLNTSDWDADTDDDKNRGLVAASLMLDNHWDWHGNRLTEDQSLRWPRTGVVDPDGYSVDDDSIPKFLREATAELARLLIDSDRGGDSDTEGFTRLKAGPLEMEIDKYDRTPTIPDSVYQMCKWYGELTSGSGINRIGLVRT